MEPKDLSDDAYKIWLVKTYDISKNELFEKYECDGRLFETLDEALQHADKNHRAAIKSNAPQVSDLDAQSTQKQDRNDSGFVGIVGGGGGIRTLDTLPYTHFPGVRLRPLGHLSVTSTLTHSSSFLGGYSPLRVKLSRVLNRRKLHDRTAACKVSA